MASFQRSDLAETRMMKNYEMKHNSLLSPFLLKVSLEAGVDSGASKRDSESTNHRGSARSKSTSFRTSANVVSRIATESARNALYLPTSLFPSIVLLIPLKSILRVDSDFVGGITRRYSKSMSGRAPFLRRGSASVARDRPFQKEIQAEIARARRSRRMRAHARCDRRDAAPSKRLNSC